MNKFTISLCQITEDDSMETAHTVFAKDLQEACLRLLNHYNKDSIISTNKIKYIDDVMYYYDSVDGIEYELQSHSNI